VRNGLLRVKIFGHEPPVYELVEHCAYVVRAPVLKVQIIGVLPHVDREQRLHLPSQRRLRIIGLHDPQLTAIEYQPRPAGAELRQRRCAEFPLERLNIAKRRIDPRSQGGRWLSAFGTQTAPIKSVIPGLRRIVKDFAVLGSSAVVVTTSSSVKSAYPVRSTSLFSLST